ncbi:MAG: MotA/TolQ/ExbB proton channel family protein [Verrucomicrobiia bacterium]
MIIPFLLANSIQGVSGFFLSGGFFMFPLVAMSIVSGAVIFLRWRALQEHRVIPPDLVRDTENLQPLEHPVQLAQDVFKKRAPLARIYRVALANLRWPKAENVEAVQTRARQEIVQLERGLIVLELVVGLGPLLGLLGTVSGLVGVFVSLDPSGTNTVGVARGIAEALNTTIMGLAVAIPSLIAHSYFSKKVEVLSVRMESLVSEMLAKCYGDHPLSPSHVALDLSEWIRQERQIEREFAEQALRKSTQSQRHDPSSRAAAAHVHSAAGIPAQSTTPKSLADLQREASGPRAK